MIQKLHFKIGSGINQLIRDIYWFEDNKAKAMNILETFVGITLTQSMDLLNGNAQFEPNDDGTVNLVYKEDKEFKKSLQDHQTFLENNKEEKLKEIEELKREKVKATGSTELCEFECQYNKENSCSYGGWNCGWGCYLDNPDRNEILSEKMLTELRRGSSGDKKFHQMSTKDIGDALLDEFENDNLEDDIIVHKNKILGPHGWLSPNGIFYQVGLFQHGNTAEDIVKMIGRIAESKGDHHKFLEEIGFILLSKERLRMTGDKKPTQKQIDRLDKFFKTKKRIIINNRGVKDITKGLLVTHKTPYGASGGDFKVSAEEIMGVGNWK